MYPAHKIPALLPCCEEVFLPRATRPGVYTPPVRSFPFPEQAPPAVGCPACTGPEAAPYPDVEIHIPYTAPPVRRYGHIHTEPVLDIPAIVCARPAEHGLFAAGRRSESSMVRQRTG